MTRREFECCPPGSTLGQKLGYVGRLIRQARYSGAYCKPHEERRATVTRLRALYRRLLWRLNTARR